MCVHFRPPSPRTRSCGCPCCTGNWDWQRETKWPHVFHAVCHSRTTKLIRGSGNLQHIHVHFFPMSNATIPANSLHACKLSRPTREASDRTTYARRPADPTERPTHLARRTTARRPNRGARAAASTREPRERCGAPERCRRPPERGQGGAGGQQGPVSGQPCDTVRGARQSCPDARARSTTK